VSYNVKASYLEIYNEELSDLLLEVRRSLARGLVDLNGF